MAKKKPAAKATEAAKETNAPTENTAKNTEEKSGQQKNVTVNAQYIKDLSFENPRAPKSFLGNDTAPQINVGINVSAAKAGENTYEVSLHFNVESKRDDEVLFIVELTYAGIFTLQGIDETEAQPTLLIFCPSLLFPFARNIISDVTRDGGFPALMIDPIDFGTLYANRQKKAENK